MAPDVADGECGTLAEITFSKVSADSPMTGGLSRTFTDNGPADAASGTVIDDGTVVSYTVAPGDAIAGIGSRFCVDYITVMKYNHVYPTFTPVTS